jgi:steroid 5-alpha reductase family enzyme
MFDLETWLAGLAVLAVLATLTWLVSVPLRNVAIVDSVWSLMFLAAAITYAVRSAPLSPRAWLVLGLVSAWALRLSLYITLRNAGHGEDRRYQAIRARNGPNFPVTSLWRVFLFQAVLAWVISLPLLGAVRGTAPFGVFDVLGALLVLVGLFFETVGDWQLARFKADPANKGRTMDRGLWRYTRHPNYFGDFCVWWGFFLIALATGAWWSIVGPVLMSTLLMRVSGVTLLEKDIAGRRPDYVDYVRRTNAFFPGPPKP